MPGKKRKAESASQNMWGSSSSPTSPSRRNNNKQSSSSRRGGGGSASGGSGAYQRINEDSASKLFDEICDEDDPNVAGMEGECIFCHCVQLSLLFIPISKILYCLHNYKIIVRNLQTMRATPTRSPRGCPCPRPTTQTRCEQKACRNFSGGMDVGL